MTFTLLQRRSSTPGHIPTTAQLGSGELSINYYDGIVYFKQSNSTANTILALSPFQNFTGDVSGSSSNSNTVLTLANVGTAGTYTALVTNSKGLVISGSNMTATGDATGTASGTNIVLTLASVATAGTYAAVVINSKGLVTSGLLTAYSGDVTGSTSGANAVLTLATVNTNIGTFGNATIVPTITVNAKGLVTAVSNSAIAFPVTSVGGSTGVVLGGTFSAPVAFTGQSTAITQPSTDNTTNVATTAFVQATSVSMAGDSMTGVLNMNAGATTITQPISDNTTNVATTAYVYALGTVFQSLAVQKSGDTMSGILNMNAGATTTTQAPGNSSTYVATTAFVQNAVGNYLPLSGGTINGNLNVHGVTSFGAGNMIFPGSAAGYYLTNEPNFAYSSSWYDAENGYARDAKFGQLGIMVVGGTATDTLVVRGNGAGIGAGPGSNGAVLAAYANGIVTVGNTIVMSNTAITTVTQPLLDNTTNVATTAFITRAAGISRYVTGAIGVSTSSGTITYGSSAPTIGSAGTLWTATITPSSTSSKIQIMFNSFFDVSTLNKVLTFVLRRGSTTIGVRAQGITSGAPQVVNFMMYDSPATTSPVTYTCYYGASAATTISVNEGTGTATLGGTGSGAYSLFDI